MRLKNNRNPPKSPPSEPKPRCVLYKGKWTYKSLAEHFIELEKAKAEGRIRD